MPRLRSICDDGNDLDGDGCSSQCTLEIQGPGGQTCAERVPLFLSRTAARQFEARAQGDTRGGTDVASPSCESSAAPQDIYALEITETSDLFVSVTPEGFAPVLYLRGADGRGCLDEQGELACANAIGSIRRELDALGVPAGVYFLFVDADGSGSGTYEMQVLASASP